MEGSIQFGNLAAPALLRAGLTQGADLVYLTGGINQQFLMGRPGLETPGQLAGGRIGFIGDGGLNDVLVQFIVERLKTDGVRDLRLVPVEGGARNSMRNLMQGACDATVITPPEAVEAERVGCHFLVDFARYGLNYALGGIAARREYIAEHEAVTRLFVKAYVEGMHRYRTDRDFTVRVQMEYSGLTDISIAEETYDMTQPGMPEAPYPVLQALRTALEVISKEIPAAATADPGGFVDDRFIRELDESGFIASL
jgi:ABC-type nitrate/sulfonate/bicarbonate transport system substrate-binding protein